MSATRGISTRREDFAGRTEVKVVNFTTCGYYTFNTQTTSPSFVRAISTSTLLKVLQRTIQDIQSFKGTRCLASNHNLDNLDKKIISNSFIFSVTTTQRWSPYKIIVLPKAERFLMYLSVYFVMFL